MLDRFLSGVGAAAAPPPPTVTDIRIWYAKQRSEFLKHLRDERDAEGEECDQVSQRMRKEEFMKGLNADLKKRFHAIGCDEKGEPFAAQEEEEEEEE